MTEGSENASFKGWTCDELTPDLCDLTVTEGRIPIQDDGLYVHYWKYSSASSSLQEILDDEAIGLPIVVLHGGPGMPHNYMLPIKQLACRPDSNGRTRDVYFYDQGGCGQSIHSVAAEKLETAAQQSTKKLTQDYPFLLDPQYYATIELPRILDFLGLNEQGYHLVANSWGTILAQYFALNTSAKGLKSMVLSGPLSDGDLYVRSQWANEEHGGYNNLGQLPPFLQQRMHDLEAHKLYDSNEYKAIGEALTGKFTSRIVPAPDCFCVSASPETGMNTDIYVGIQGPSEFTLGGVLEHFNTTSRLSSITVPVSLTSGAFDTMRPPVVDAMYRSLPRAEWSISRVSGHVTMIDDAGWTNNIIDDFLRRVEDSEDFSPDLSLCGLEGCLTKTSSSPSRETVVAVATISFVGFSVAIFVSSRNRRRHRGRYDPV